MAKRKPKAEQAPSSWAMEALATYNAEVARGIVHTPEWCARMATLQERFDADLAEQAQWEAEAYAARRREQVNLR